MFIESILPRAITNGIVGAWVPARRRTGDVIEDLSRFKQTGVLSAMTPGTDWITQDGVPCLDFDNTDDYIALGNLPHFATANDATVLCFLRTNAQASGTVNSYWASYNTGSPYQGFGLDCGGNAISTGQSIWDGGSWKDSSASTTAAATWQLVGASMRGTACTFWANGRAAGTTTLGTRGTWTGGKAIGPAPPPFSSTFTGTLFNGQIAFLLLWQKCLEVAEVNAVYKHTQQEWWKRGRKPAVVRGASLSNYSLTADAGAFTLSGQSAGVLRALAVSGDVGTFSLTGQSAGALATRTISSDAANFALGGQNAGLLAAYSVSAAASSFSLTGQDAALLKGFSITFDVGTFNETGQNAGLLATRQISTDAGSFSVSSQDATLTKTSASSLAADVGTFAFVGQAATLMVARLLGGAATDFVLAGQDANLSKAITLTAEVGSFNESGQDALLKRTARLAVNAASFTFTGQNAQLTFAGGGLSPAPYYYQMMMGG